MSAVIDPQTPVLVGVGAVHQDVGEPGGGLDVLGLLLAAATAAGEDAGAPGLLRAIQHVGVPRGTWTHPDPGGWVAEQLGSAGAFSVLAELGVPQQTLVSGALAAIESGQAGVALVVGGEARRRAQRAERAGVSLHADRQPGGVPGRRVLPRGEIVAEAEMAAGLVAPVAHYAQIDNALRAAEGQSVPDHLAEIDRLWASFNAVAGQNPHAAFAEPQSAEDLRSGVRDGNRLLAFPYNKWHSTQWTVDQAAALLLCSVEVARASGIPEERWLHPHVALESSHVLAVTRRRLLHRWPAMRLLGEAAAGHLGRPLGVIVHAELYSCFPAAVRVQQRELGLAVDGVPTLTGGMAFAGGPFNNFTYQATKAVADAVRADDSDDALGLVSTVSGYLTKPGLMVWGRSPSPNGLLTADMGEAAAAATEAVPVLGPGTLDGAGTVATYTVTPDVRGALRLVAVVDLDGQRRTIAFSEDQDLAAAAMTTELIGHPVTITASTLTPISRT